MSEAPTTKLSPELAVDLDAMSSLLSMICFDEFKTYSEQRGPSGPKAQAVLDCFVRGKAAMRDSCEEELMAVRDCLVANPKKIVACKEARHVLELCGAKNILKK